MKKFIAILSFIISHFSNADAKFEEKINEPLTGIGINTNTIGIFTVSAQYFDPGSIGVRADYSIAIPAFNLGYASLVIPITQGEDYYINLNPGIGYQDVNWDSYNMDYHNWMATTTLNWNYIGFDLNVGASYNFLGTYDMEWFPIISIGVMHNF
jgi:hypothetical protein